MNNTQLIWQVIRVFLSLALVVALALLLWTVRFTIIYVLIAAIFALIGKPLVDFLSGQTWRKLKINRTLAAAITLFLMVFIFGGVLVALIPSLIFELEALTDIDVNQLFNETEIALGHFREVLTGEPVDVTLEEPLLKKTFLRILNFENISNTFESLISGLGNVVFAIFSIIFITFFFLRERHLFRQIVLAIIPDRFEGRVLLVAPRLKKNLSRYFLGLVIQVSLITTLISLGLTAIGFENTLVIGFFAGLLNLIPYVGPLIGMAFGIILGVSQYAGGDFPYALSTLILLVVIVFSTVQMMDNFILQPIIFSNSINAHPLEIFIVISVAASLSGISGMIVAVPVYSVIRLLAGEFLPKVKFIKRLTDNK